MIFDLLQSTSVNLSKFSFQRLFQPVLILKKDNLVVVLPKTYGLAI
jgi:hypothetical protein